ncbi:MAG: hypothetical protein WCH01_09745 [Methylococcaceae bacterium]
MPAYLVTIFNYSSKDLTVHNSETKNKWVVSHGNKASGDKDCIPWAGKGVLRITTNLGEVWDVDDGDWHIWITTPGRGREQAAKYPGSINQNYNLDFFDAGPKITWI